MKQDLVDLAIIVDRSGSMVASIEDFTRTLHEYLDTQKKLPQKFKVTLVDFGSDVVTRHSRVSLKTLGHPTFTISGMTRLYDAIGHTVTMLGNQLTALQEDERPEQVIVVIITDGEENSSVEYTLAQIHEMITHQQSVYNWNFLYFGANQDAFAAGAGLGISLDHTVFYKQTLDSYGGTTVVLNNATRNLAAGNQYTVSNAERQLTVQP